MLGSVNLRSRNYELWVKSHTSWHGNASSVVVSVVSHYWHETEYSVIFFKWWPRNNMFTRYTGLSVGRLKPKNVANKRCSAHLGHIQGFFWLSDLKFQLEVGIFAKLAGWELRKSDFRVKIKRTTRIEFLISLLLCVWKQWLASFSQKCTLSAQLIMDSWISWVL